MVEKIYIGLLIFTVAAVSSNYNLQNIESLVPPRSVIRVLGDFNPER